jgi:hypothetical protein
MGIIYRVENPDSNQGLWYDADGNFSPFIKKLSDAKCKDLPMDFDTLYKEGGYAWISACDSLPDMRNWFNYQDLVELKKAGYDLYQFKVTGYKQVPGHVIFTRESVIETAKLDINLLSDTSLAI